LKGNKLTKTQFKEAFKRGLGHSYVVLKESNDREKYKDIVLWSCLHNTCFNAKSKFGDKRVDIYLQKNAHA